MNILHIGNQLNDDQSIEGIIRSINPTYFIVTLKDGKKAVEFLYALKEAKITSFFDLIFLDLELSPIDGFTILSTIKNDTVLKTIPVVIVSETSFDFSKQIEIGGIAYIQKQSEFIKIENTIKKVIGIIEKQLKAN